MGKNIIRIVKLIIGLFVYAVGVVMTINANLGLSPWDVFHQGLSGVINITLGQASIAVAFLITVLDIVLGQPIGWATIVNMLSIGTFMDILMINNLIPTANGLFTGLLMILLGLIVQGYGCWLYVNVGLGVGPRDGLMVILTKRTGKTVRFNKSVIELGAVIIGYLLGGSIGIGTVVMAFLGGPIFQLVFKTVNFNVEEVNHRFIQEDIRFLKEKLKSKEAN